ncbi:MAG TPA: hypothetical protein VE913_13175, partial [Longimicrobium sp.]|nr:hypothetical protein [Longimicrobium sp.]
VPDQPRLRSDARRSPLRLNPPTRLVTTMTNKLALRLDDLEVESFATLRRVGGASGTVRAHAGDEYSELGCTLHGCPSQQPTCGAPPASGYPGCDTELHAAYEDTSPMQCCY